MQNNLSIGKLFSIRSLLIVLIVLMLGNLVYLDFLAFGDTKEAIIKQPIASLPIQTPQGIIQGTSQTCPMACLSQIYEATASASVKKTSPAPKPAAANNVSQTKEFFVPFGSGSTIAGDWEDVGGLKAYIDTTKYSSIKTIVFEASVRIPTGNETAFVRLFNETDKHPVWFSEVSMGGGEPKFLVSSPITLESGNKLYKVQMKTDLKFTAILDQARIHITTN